MLASEHFDSVPVYTTGYLTFCKSPCLLTINKSTMYLSSCSQLKHSQTGFYLNFPKSIHLGNKKKFSLEGRFLKKLSIYKLKIVISDGAQALVKPSLYIPHSNSLSMDKANFCRFIITLLVIISL